MGVELVSHYCHSQRKIVFKTIPNDFPLSFIVKTVRACRNIPSFANEIVIQCSFSQFIFGSQYYQTQGSKMANCGNHNLSPTGNGDQVDVFGFKKPNYDNKLFAKMATDKDEMFYNMHHKRRGLAVIFSHEIFEIEKLRPRTGTKVDAINLKKNLMNLGFEVIIHEDLRTRKVFEEVNKLADYNHTDCDCFFLAVLSHGEMGILYGRDSPYKPEQLWSPFTANKCPTLAGKPKLFFIQACQGDQLDSGITLVKRTEVDGHVTYKIPNHADFLIAYSTIPGFYSWRNTTKGSWFIQALCQELEENSDKLDLLSLLTMVSRRVAFDFESNTPNDRAMHQQKQIPCITSMLTRLIRFQPKGYQMDIF